MRPQSPVLEEEGGEGGSASFGFRCSLANHHSFGCLPRTSTSSANSTDGRSSSPHRHHVHAARPHLPFLAQTFSCFNVIGCKMTCCGSSLPLLRFASIDVRMVHGDLAMDSGLERSVGRWTGRGSAWASPSLLVLGRSVSSRYVCADILYDRSVEQGREGA